MRMEMSICMEAGDGLGLGVICKGLRMSVSTEDAVQ